MAKHLDLGLNGELLAERFLAAKGMKIVDRRVRYKQGELDLVAKDGNDWVFVEVKTRKSAEFGTAAEAFTLQKARRMRRAVELYIQENSLHGQSVRCDFVGIDLDPDGMPEISHFPGGISW